MDGDKEGGDSEEDGEGTLTRPSLGTETRPSLLVVGGSLIKLANFFLLK